MKETEESLAMAGEPFPASKFLKLIPETRAETLAERSALFFWARNGIYHALHALSLRPGAHVLIPAYLCTAAVEPFLQFGAEVEFYNVGRDCRADIADIESKIRANTGAVLAVHYFGFPQNIKRLRQICDLSNVALMEDCAHVLQGEYEGQPLGSFGDISFFSWRKFLPLYDGAELRLNRWAACLNVAWHKEGLTFTGKVAKCLLDRTLEQSHGVFQRGTRRTFEFLTRSWKFATGIKPDMPVLALDSNQSSFDQHLLNQPMSRVSRWLLKHADLAGIAEQRRKNFIFLLREIRKIQGVRPLHSELPVGICPWVFPLTFDGLTNAHLALRNSGIPAVTWGAVRPHIQRQHQFEDADFLYENLVFLPVHQNLRSHDLERIVQSVATVATSRSLPTYLPSQGEKNGH